MIIQVCNTPEANAGSVAQHTMALLLACANKIVYMDQLTRNGKWDMRNKIRTVDVSGKTLGIIGYGRVGSLVAKAASHGSGMPILVYSRHTDKKDLPQYISKCNDIDDIFKKSDFVSVHSSLTEETLKMVNNERLQMMKKTAYLINTSRGAVVDENALYKVLYEGLIAGAGLDVFKVEPAIKENPIYKLHNVIVSPHYAGLTQESMDQMGLDAAKGIVEVLYGNKVTWPVN